MVDMSVYIHSVSPLEGDAVIRVTIEVLSSVQYIVLIYLHDSNWETLGFLF